MSELPETDHRIPMPLCKAPRDYSYDELLSMYDNIKAERDILEDGIEQVIKWHSPAEAVMVQVKLRLHRRDR